MFGHKQIMDITVCFLQYVRDWRLVRGSVVLETLLYCWWFQHRTVRFFPSEALAESSRIIGLHRWNVCPVYCLWNTEFSNLLSMCHQLQYQIIQFSADVQVSFSFSDYKIGDIFTAVFRVKESFIVQCALCMLCVCVCVCVCVCAHLCCSSSVRWFIFWWRFTEFELSPVINCACMCMYMYTHARACTRTHTHTHTHTHTFCHLVVVEQR